MAEQLTLRDLTTRQLRVYTLDPPGPEWLAAGVLTLATAALLRSRYLDIQTLLTIFTPREILSYSHIESLDGVSLLERFDLAGLTEEFSRQSDSGTFLLFPTWPTQETPTATLQYCYTLCKWETAYRSARKGALYAPYWVPRETWALWVLLSLQAAASSSTWQEYKDRIYEIAAKESS